MGKRVKAKPKNLRKAQQQELPVSSSDVGSTDSASQDASHSTEETAVSATGRDQCSHYGHDRAHLDKVLLEILSSKHIVSCEHCREDTHRKKGGAGGKEKGGKQQKKKGVGSKGAGAKAQAKEKSDLWVCLDCGRHFCGGAGAVADTKPYGHSRRHAKQDRHWWAAQYDDPTVAYCVSCEKAVAIEIPKVEKVEAVAVDDNVVSTANHISTAHTDVLNCQGNVIKGLPNLGNTCFFNSVLQSLLTLDRLRKKMLGPDVPTGAMSMSLKKLFVDTSASSNVGGALSPKNLFSSICSKYPQFRGYQMHDSHELLRCFLDGLRTEEIEARKQLEDASNEGVPTIVDSIFGGQLSSTVSSTECSHSSIKYDQILDLSLPVPSKRPPAKSVLSPPAKRTKQSIRDKNKSRRFGKLPARASPPAEESNKEKGQTVAGCNNSQIPGPELGQVASEKEHEPSECSESCTSVSNQEQKATSNVEDSVCWLDYIADDADESKSEILDSAGSAEAGEVSEHKDAINVSFQDGVLPKEQIWGSEQSGENTVDDAASLQPVILLPYGEFGTTAKEMGETDENSQNPEYAAPPVSPGTEDNTQPASAGGDVEQDDCLGLGDMFNEPEVTSEVKKETGKAGDIDVMSWSSNSADDEVDNSESPISIERCLALYTEAELLSEPWHCEHCSNAACPHDEGKDVVEMLDNANETKNVEEMMEDGDERRDAEELNMSCSKKENADIDQTMATDCCSDNSHSNKHCEEIRCANSSDGPEQTSYCKLPIESIAVQKASALLIADKTEQSNGTTCLQEPCRDLKSSPVECASLSEQPHELAMQNNNGYNVNITAEGTSAPLSCGGNNSVSSSRTNSLQSDSGGGAEEVVSSSLPSDAQIILPSVKDGEDVSTRNQGRRKRAKRVDNGHQMQGSQNKQKENQTKVFRAAMRRILISKAPPVLTINLNRFSQDSHGRLKKLRGHVLFKEMLDIRPFMDPRSKESDNTTYRLVAVVEHLGTMTGGHYIAYVRAGKIGGRQQQSSGSSSWFYASDAHVREASLEEVLKCDAYILFYERVGD